MRAVIPAAYSQRFQTSLRGTSGPPCRVVPGEYRTTSATTVGPALPRRRDESESWLREV